MTHILGVDGRKLIGVVVAVMTRPRSILQIPSEFLSYEKLGPCKMAPWVDGGCYLTLMT